MDQDEQELKEEVGYESQLNMILENTDPQPALLHLSG